MSRSLGGLWADRMRTNRERTIPHGYEQLGHAGNLTNFRLAAGAQGTYQALGGADRASSSRSSTPTSTSGSRPSAGSSAAAADPDARAPGGRGRSRLVAAAQRPGRLPQHATSRSSAPGSAYRDLPWGHELYCAGHLIQAAVAWHRAHRRRPAARGRVRASPTASSASSGPAGRDGHRRAPRDRDGARRAVPETGERRYLELAASLRRPARPRACSATGRFGPAYCQDHAPGARRADGRRPRRAPAVPRLRRGRRRRRDRRPELLDAVAAPLATTWPRRARTSPAGSAPPPRRGVRRPVRAAARPRLRRDLRRDRERAARPGGCCWPPATRPAPT